MPRRHTLLKNPQGHTTSVSGRETIVSSFNAFHVGCEIGGTATLASNLSPRHQHGSEYDRFLSASLFEEIIIIIIIKRQTGNGGLDENDGISIRAIRGVWCGQHRIRVIWTMIQPRRYLARCLSKESKLSISMMTGDLSCLKSFYFCISIVP